MDETRTRTADVPGFSSGAPLIDAVADWLMSQALGDTDMEGLIDGCCNRLHAAGIPLLRAHVAFRTLHPLFEAVSLTWRRREGIETTGYRHGDAEQDAWRQSPYFHMIETRIPFLRRRLAGPEATLDFPILTEFRDEGATDYFAYLVGFGVRRVGRRRLQDGICGSWTTDRRSGFSDSDIRSLNRIQRRLAVACKVTINNQIARNVVTTYLGPDAGQQVLHGQIKRGDGETVHAVVWLSDLRNSTELADTMPTHDFLSVLNSYFECTAGAVLAHGGDVLLFVGDAVLAMFPIRDGEAPTRAACQSALNAAREAQLRLAKVNRERAKTNQATLAFGIGLHVGHVVYGNIGVPERLQFTVIGSATNVASRLEDLTKALDRNLLVSAEFAANLPVAWEPMGRHELRGLGERQEVFAAPPA
ncbi:MAG: adenylate/guanylate cyclase domain-containing protein [Kiloniellales bacterium]